MQINLLDLGGNLNLDRDLFFNQQYHRMTLKETREFNLERNKHFFELIDEKVNHKVVTSGVDMFQSICQTKEVIVDFGCGNTYFSSTIRNALNPKTIIGIDIIDLNDYCSNVFGNVDQFVKTDGATLEVPSESVDGIFAFYVFHFNISVKMIQELIRVLKTGGCIAWNCFNTKGEDWLEEFQHYGLILKSKASFTVNNIPDSIIVVQKGERKEARGIRL